MKDIGNYLPILIALAFGIFQLFRFLSRGASGESKSTPPPTDPFGGKQGGGDWDDLMEALGQKEKPKSSGPILPPTPQPRVEPVMPKPRTVTPPVLPKYVPEVRPPVPVLVPQFEAPSEPSVPYEFYQPKIAEASALKFKNFDSENAAASKAPAGLSTPALPGLQASRFRQFLSDQERLREAIVLNEILSKPVALR